MSKSKAIKFLALGLCLLLTASCMMACKSEEQLVAAQTESVRESIVNYVDLRSTLTVSGSGKVSLLPDTATLYVSVRTENKDASAAQQENATLLAAVLEAVKALGIPDGDLETDALQLNEQYNYDKTPYEITGYVAENGVTVTLHDLDLVGRVLSDAVAAGANSVNGPVYSITDTSAAYASALAAAMADAGSKAAVMAEGASVSLNPLPISVSERSSSDPLPYESPAMGERATASAAADNGLAETPVSLAEQDVTAEVTVVYEITK